MADAIIHHCVICGIQFFAASKRTQCCSYRCGYELKKLNLEKSFPERFWSKVRILSNEECWEWQGCTNDKGYGCGTHAMKGYSAHRVAYRLGHASEIPTGLEVRHKCDNPGCCNPSHLELGTHTDNMRDMSSRGRSGGQVLSEQDAIEIRRMYFEDGERQLSIAKKYHVCKATISSVVRGKNWKHLGVPPEEIIKAAQKKPRPHLDLAAMSHVKLNNDIVRQIRADFASGEKQCKLVARYLVSPMTISNVVRNQTWKYVE